MDSSHRAAVCAVAAILIITATPVNAEVVDADAAEMEKANLGSVSIKDWEVQYMASILAGETAYGCEQCHQWIACTIARDAARYKRSGKSIKSLHPGRWNGFRPNPSTEYVGIMWKAMVGSLCEDAPVCRFVGNEKDYKRYWTGYGNAMLTGNENGLVVCVPHDNSEVPSDDKEAPSEPQANGEHGEYNGLDSRHKGKRVQHIR